MNITPEKKKRFTGWLLGIATACIIIFLCIQNISAVSKAFSWFAGIAMPLLVGVAMAVVVNVPMRSLEKILWKKSKRPFLCKLRRIVAFLLSLIFILGIFVGAVMLVLPTLIDTVTVLAQSAFELVDRISSMDQSEISELPFGQMILEIDWEDLVNSIKTWVSDRSHAIVNTIFGTASSLVVAIIDFFVAVAFSVYLLFSKEKLKGQFERIVKAWIPKEKGDWILHAFSVANHSLRSFIAGQSLEAVILGLLCFLGMLIFNFPYAAMISTLVGVTALVPIIGGFIGGGIGAFMILTQDPIKALWFVVYLVVLQLLEGNIIYPKVMGDRVNLSAMIVLAAVTIGGGIAGPVGMLLSVPLASTAYVLFKEATIKRENEMKEISEE